MIRILHTADVHLDSPLRSLALRNPELSGRVRTSSRTALTRIVDTALAEARKLAKLAPDAPVKLVYYPRHKPLWQRILQRDSDEARLAETVKALAEGRVRTPGPVWMPPIEIE